MTRHALLNNTEHRDLRVLTTRSAALGDDLMAVLTFPAEFRNIQAHYPIVFTKSREGTYTPLALLGFREKQNLFLKPDCWDAPYVPIMIERAPFFVGNSSNGKMIHIDLDSPRVSRTEGEAVFLEHGGNSDFLGRVGGMLATIHDGVAATEPLVDALREHNLLESFALDIEFRDGSHHRLAGFETVQEDRLSGLKGEALEKLHQRGHLQAIYMIIASLSNFRGLIERANKLNAAER